MRNNNIKMMVLASLFAAIIAVCAQIIVPVGPVPFTLQVLAINLTGMILGSRWGAVSAAVYLTLGAVGAPVFAGFNGGFQALIGKTGGYIISFIPAAFVIGWIMERGKVSVGKAFLANLLGLLMTYARGTAQLKFVLNLPWEQAFQFGVIPFLIPDLIKLGLASTLGVVILNRLTLAGLRTRKTSSPM